MRVLETVLVSLFVSLSVSLGVFYYAPGPALSPEELKEVILKNMEDIKTVAAYTKQYNESLEKALGIKKVKNEKIISEQPK